MPSGGVRVTGLNAKIKNLEKMGVAVADLKAAFAEISNRAAEIAANLAPKLTGKLAASVRGSKTKNRALVTAGNKATTPYAGAINYGWAARGIVGHEFMQRASDQVSPTAVETLNQSLDKLIRDNGLES